MKGKRIMRRYHHYLLDILAPEVAEGEHRWLVNQTDFGKIKTIVRDESVKWFLIGIVTGIFLLLLAAVLAEAYK